MRQAIHAVSLTTHCQCTYMPNAFTEISVLQYLIFANEGSQAVDFGFDSISYA